MYISNLTVQNLIEKIRKLMQNLEIITTYIAPLVGVNNEMLNTFG